MCDFMVVNQSKKFRIDKYLAEVVRRRRLLSEDEDGWGVFFYDGIDWVVIKEPLAAWKSPFFLWFERKKFNVQAKTLIIHVRKATHGEISWFNTHPFTAEVNGKRYVFAHKGDVSKFVENVELKKLKPRGETDSEKFFLYLLENIEEYDNLLEAAEKIDQLSDKVEFGNRLNFFLFDGEYLLVYDGADEEPLYYSISKNRFLAASEEFKDTEMGEIGESRLLVVKDGRVVKDIK